MEPPANPENQPQGVFIVIEGTDGSGKGTQFKLLKERLAAYGYDVATFDFPQYDSPSSYFVKEYLNGNYGSAEAVGPYSASLFYALDRYEAAGNIRKALSEGKIVLANRFAGSNMAHQGGKFNHSEERRGFFLWDDSLEFQMLNIPRPLISFVLRVPAEVAQRLVDQKDARTYTDKKRDLHEADLNHLRRSVEVYDELCSLFPRDFFPIDCTRDGALLSVPAINNLIWRQLESILPAPPRREDAPARLERASVEPTPATSQPVADATADKANVPLVKKRPDGNWQFTEAGKTFLEQVVTSVNSDVYAFRRELDSITIAAAMARLSRRGDDMRITILDEFANKTDKDSQLLHRVITAYGDDSVQQLAGQHLVVENASQLLTKKLEWGRLASYLEQSTRYIYYDQKDARGRYKYYVPRYLKPTVRQRYTRTLDEIFGLYSSMVRTLTDYIQEHDATPAGERDGAWRSATRAQACDAIRPVLPVATKSTVGIFASGQALENLIMHLQADELQEARQVGDQILTETRKVIGTFLERADKPERGGATVAYMSRTKAGMKTLTEKYLPSGYADANDPVRLSKYWPANELDLVADMMYEHSDQSLADIQRHVEKLKYKDKERIFRTYMGERLNRRHRPGRAVEKAHYSWDLVCDYGIFRDLQRHRMVDDLEWQALTPRYGFEVPDLVEQAGLSDDFEKCFDLSAALYSELQAADYMQEAQYATLLGHKMRWKLTYNAREAFHLHELRTSPQGHPGYRKLVQQMHEKLAEVHPLMAESMIFFNKGDDPKLTRLAAERYTQFKLEKMDRKKS